MSLNDGCILSVWQKVVEQDAYCAGMLCLDSVQP